MSAPPDPAVSPTREAIEATSSLMLAERLRLAAGRALNSGRQAEFGQFFTNAQVAEFMASLFEAQPATLRLLDAGAGIGSLTAAFVSEVCRRNRRPQRIKVTAYETDTKLIPYLEKTLLACRSECERVQVEFEGQAVPADFIGAAGSLMNNGLFASGERFDCAILNPPYRKLRSDSEWRRTLSLVGIETSNLYSAFLWLAMRLLEPGGELVAITPRSFCNGPYFKPFRVALLQAMELRRFHVFESREEAFRQDRVLQENIIFHAVKKAARARNLPTPVVISTSTGPGSMGPGSHGATHRQAALAEIIRPGDGDVFINLVPDEDGQRVAEQMSVFPATLVDLGIGVSTGRVVDFRATAWLRLDPSENAGEQVAPLIYPLHFSDGFVRWPKLSKKKPNAIAVTPETLPLLNSRGFYVLVKRFSSKEQKRRIMAALYDPDRVVWEGISAPAVGFENHLNYFHENGMGLPQDLAAGLAAYLNSTLVDLYFRQFNGHTQVNATDLRSLKYPARSCLESLGRHIWVTHGPNAPPQVETDDLIREEIAHARRTRR